MNQIIKRSTVDQGVYNGRRKIHAKDWMFMTSERINECIKSLKIKPEFPRDIIKLKSVIFC